jgi:hypothetical protein
MDNKKWYYEFFADKVENKEDGSSSKEKLKFAILKPNRRQREDGELFYASETSRFAKAGVLPKAAWNTILSNGGGSISEQDREEYGKLLSDYRTKSFDLQAILIRSNGNLEEQDKTAIESITNDLTDIKNKIQAFEASQINVFENTAEAKARNRAILWWVTTLAYKNVDGKYVPIFGQENFDAKLDAYDEIEQSEGEDFLLAILRRFTYLITLWFLGRANTTAEFKDLDDAFTKSSEVVEAPSTEEVKTEEVKSE